jgi:hypothetical protein
MYQVGTWVLGSEAECAESVSGKPLGGGVLVGVATHLLNVNLIGLWDFRGWPPWNHHALRPVRTRYVELRLYLPDWELNLSSA